MTYTPPFTISAKAISMIAEISALMERYAIRLEQHDALKLRKANKIKTIQSSLAIEGNTLSEGQVTDILDGGKAITSFGGVNGGVIGGVNVVLEYIRNHPGSRANAIADALNIPPRTVERYLKQLKPDAIEFRGAPRNGGYYLKEN